MNWQPIETAPKDGTWILLYAKGKMYVATWDQLDYNSERYWVYGPEDTHGFRSGVYEATHWMPLPSQPAVSKSEQGAG